MIDGIGGLRDALPRPPAPSRVTAGAAVPAIDRRPLSQILGDALRKARTHWHRLLDRARRGRPAVVAGGVIVAIAGKSRKRSRRRGLMLAFIVWVGTAIALLAVPRLLGIDDREGVFLQLFFAMLTPMFTFGLVAIGSLPGIERTVTKAPERNSQFKGWKPPTASEPGTTASPRPVSNALRRISSHYGVDGDERDMAAIAALFPGPVVLDPLKRKYATGLIFCLVFVAIGFEPEAPLAMRLVVFTIFGTGALAFAVDLLPGSGAGALTLSRRGFDIRRRFRRRRYRWVDIADFGVWGRDSSLFVVFYEPENTGTLASLNFMLGGSSGYLPNACGFHPENLAKLLNYWRAEALASATDTAPDLGRGDVVGDR